MSAASRLWVRLSAVMAAVALAVVVIMAGGLWLYAVLLELSARRALPPSVREELVRLERNPVANDARLAEIYLQYYREPPISEVAVVLAALGALGSAVAIGGSVMFARRVTQPLASVGEAARSVRQGELSARAEFPRGVAAGAEIAKLVEDFNALAAALEDGERRLRENAAAIAHELRTPLTVLTGRLQGLVDRVFDATPEEHAMLLGQVATLSKIVDDLRMISLADAGQLAVEAERLDLASVVGEVLTAMGARIAAVGLHTSADLRPASTRADPDRVRQVVYNLVENAIRYSACGGELRVETGVDRGRAYIRVLDRGPGLPPGAPEELFRPFTRGDPSRARASGGSGLGLAVVAAVVAAHGGAALATNREGGGAEFRVSFRSSR